MPAISPDQAAMNRLRVMRLLDLEYSSATRRAQAVLQHIQQAETEAGSYFMRSYGQLYMFCGMTRRILKLPFGGSGEEVAGYLDGMYGLPKASPLGRAVYDHLQAYALNQAAKAELRRFAVYDKKSLTAYLSTYDGQMWRIDGGEPTRVINGENDVFFVDDDGGETVEPDIAPHGILLERLINLNYTEGLGGIKAEQQRMAMTVWLFMLAFPDFIAGKPLLMIEGTQGSGKSISLQLIQLALMGLSRPMSLNRNKEDDFGVILLRAPIAVFDNTDSYIDWVADAVCLYCTRGYWVKRKLYSNDDEAIIRPHSFIAVASKNPASFRREDTVDRQIVIRLERRETFKPPEVLEAEVLALRPQLMGEYIWYVNQIVEHLRTTNDVAVADETTRMADFARFARVVSAVLNWEAGAVDEMLAGLASERDAFASEEDPLIELLHLWIVYRGKGISSIGRKVTLQMLYAELQSMAQGNDIQNFYKSPRQLAQKIRSPHIERDFDVVISIENRQRVYQFWRKTDPRLTAIDGGLSLSDPSGTEEE
jgi:hypothetical protein